MKNKKNLIGKMVILLMVSVLCVLGVLFVVKSKMKDKEDVAIITTENNIQEETNQSDIASENEQLEKFSNMKIAEAVTQEITEQQSNENDNQQEETSQVVTSKSKESESKKTTVAQKQTQASQPVQSQKQQTIQSSATGNQQKQTTTTQTQTTKVEGEKFVRNDTMINKIKSIINNNQSDNMKTHGYTIQVDPSIKTKTNQFTFTESRVINFIKYSFGTIRVYAEDYYNNGQFIMTECYIF